MDFRSSTIPGLSTRSLSTGRRRASYLKPDFQARRKVTSGLPLIRPWPPPELPAAWTAWDPARTRCEARIAKLGRLCVGLIPTEGGTVKSPCVKVSSQWREDMIPWLGSASLLLNF